MYSVSGSPATMNAIARVPSGARVPVHRSRSAILRGRAIVKASAKDELAVMVNSCTGKVTIWPLWSAWDDTAHEC